MKAGMKEITKQQVGDRWFWLASDNSEWATYTSNSPDAGCTEYGRYFANRSSAIADFNTRVKAHRP